MSQAQATIGHRNERTNVLLRLSDPACMDAVAVVKALRGCDAGIQLNIVPLAHLFRSKELHTGGLTIIIIVTHNPAVAAVAHRPITLRDERVI